MQLMLKRQFSYYLVQLYGPTTMIVIVSWVYVSPFFKAKKSILVASG